MEAIFSSKLYKASTRKDKIHAALNDPANVELVTQLRSYLDDEYKDLAISPKKKAEVDNFLEEENTVPESDFGSDMPSFGGGGFSGGGSSFGSGQVDLGDSDVGELDNEFEDVPDSDISDDSFDEEPEMNEDEEIESATDIIDPDPVELTEEVKELLKDSTEIRQVRSKNDEIWVYYNDDTNLNHVMEDAISKVVSNTDHVEFNRLARSDNAIVFLVS